MAFTTADSQALTLLCMHYGIPCILFFILSSFVSHQFQYRIWRWRMWSHRACVPLALPPLPPDFTSPSHRVETGISAAIRMSLVPFYSLFSVAVFMAGPALLVVWACAMHFLLQKTMQGLAIVLGGMCIALLYYSIQYWRAGNYRMNPLILLMFLGTFVLYFALAFLLAYLTPSVSFFAESIHFLILNYLLVVELLAQVEVEHSLPAAALLRASDMVSGAAGSNTDEALQEFKQQEQMLAKLKQQRAQQRLARDSFEYDGENGDGDDENDENEFTLVNIRHATLQLQDAIAAVVHDSMQQQTKHLRIKVALYLSSILVLIAYALMLYYRYSSQTQTRYLGWIILSIIVVWDLLCYLYSSSGRITQDYTKVLMLGGGRLVLIVFGIDGWFLGVCLLYGVVGCYLAFVCVDVRFPYQSDAIHRYSLHGMLGKKQMMLFSEFVCDLKEEKKTGIEAPTDSLMNAVKTSKITIPEFILIIFTILFFMTLGVAYVSKPHPVVISDSSNPVDQHILGFLAFYIVLLFLSSALTIRCLMTTDWRITPRSLVFVAITQIFYTIAAGVVWEKIHSVIVIVLLMCGPLFTLSLMGTYYHCIKVDWTLLQPPEMRNPPMMPFCLAFLTCGLQRNDVKMFFSIAMVGTMLTIIALAISLGMNGSVVGWSIAWALFIIITSITPMIKYLKTLTLDKVDVILLGCFVCSYIAFFLILFWQIYDLFTSVTTWIYWSCFLAYPLLLANIICYYGFMENGKILTRNHTALLTLTFFIVCVIVIASFFTISPAIGGMILAVLAIALLLITLLVKWSRGNFTLSRPLRWLATFAFIAIIVIGVVLGWLLPENDGFWSYTGSWALLCAYVFIMAHGDKAHLCAGSKSAQCFKYSTFIFPVYSYDKRNNDIVPANKHIALFCVAYAMIFAWCVVCMTTTRINIGLICSAVTLVIFYTFLRNLTLESHRQFVRRLSFMNEELVLKTKQLAKETQLAGCSYDIPQSIKTCIEANENPQPLVKQLLQDFKHQINLNSLWPFGVLHVSPMHLDETLDRLDALHNIARGIAKLYFCIEAHFYFLILVETESHIQAEQAQMKSFCNWLKSVKNEILDPYITHHDIYHSSVPWSQMRIQQYQFWKKEYLESFQKKIEVNENNRKAEEEAAKRREELIAEREEKMVKVDATTGEVINKTAPDKAMEEFNRIVEEYERTGKLYEDPDFPASPESLYLEGERVAGKPSIIHASALGEWRRPTEILQEIKEQGQTVHDPAVAIDGFDLHDIVQGNIGTCYLLSAMGVMALREQKDRSLPLLSTMIYVPQGAVYNKCGAFLVRFYRQGKEIKILVDDRLPCLPNGQLAFSHSQDPAEMWVALLEKAYARLYGCYEAIEAGFTHQALVDMTNGASEEIRIRGPDGNMIVNADTLWLQLKDAQENKYLLGAGSNTGTNDHAVNGIVQGHAYSIVRLFSDARETERLIQLQNPWGHGEWDGDWGDNSDKWTKWWKESLKQDEAADDGRFWMSFSDFLLHYENVYICRLLPLRSSLSSAWHGHTACGPLAPYHNPTFVVTCPKPMKIWVELEQDSIRVKKKPTDDPAAGDASSAAATGKYAFIQFYLFDNGGKRVQKIEKDAIKGWANGGKMKNVRQISAEVYIDAPDRPYSIVCVTNPKGVETGFTLSIFSTEPIKFELLPEEVEPTQT